MHPPRVVALAALVLSLLGCQAPPPDRPSVQPAAQPAAAATPARVPVRLAQAYVASSLIPLWLAQENGYFREQGLDVEALLMRGSIEGVQALAAGEVQGLLTAPTPATIGAAIQDPDIVILGTLSNRLQYQFVSNVPTVPELRGKRIGISRPGDASYSLAVQTLERYGLGVQDIQFASVGNIPERLAALVSGQVDGTVVTTPLNVQAVKAGFYQVADLGDLGIPYIATSIHMKRSYAEQNPAVTDGLLKGFMQGVHAVVAQPAQAKALFTKYLDLRDEDELEAAYQTNALGGERTLAPSMSGLQDVITQLAAENPGAAGMRAEQFVDLRAVQQIEASGFVQQLWDQ
ncbi:MAG TPA: ABC transporter substrate-binding protein [Chloroflexota bacterium]|nr:ABC transporter substrate-binding protein [Chloroflexota bacterium]